MAVLWVKPWQRGFLMVLTLEMLSHPLFLEDTLLLVRTYDRTKFSDVAVLFHSSLLRKFKKLTVVGNNSQTSHKRSPKMGRINGCLWKVIVDEDQTTGGVFQEEVWTHLL